ncbi:ATP-binding protein [Aequorivita viscosa]|nr:ATP-binding protein [Aequorivita viscosa]
MNGQIDAKPTKDFFISMLVRDISLKDAIGDLLDNCIDGAKRLRGNKSYKGLKVNIVATPMKFSISDNCGGIDLEIARKYAFRFGRPDKMEGTNYSIGQFGIGMKRALFKLGNEFEVSSSTTINSFSMKVDVDVWKSKTDDWTFSFENSEELEIKKQEEETGTIISLNKLNEDAITAFNDDIFLQELHNELELDHLYNINKGLDIYLNGIKLKSKKLNLIVSQKFKIGKWEHNFDDEVNVKLIVGLGSSDEQLGGWYIFCNQRLIVGPDKSRLTGWTGRKGDGVANYHHQYWRFRGFAFFEAEDSSKLPWNTTKTGMNTDSPIFKAVRLQMIEMMKSVINGFLNSLKKENESDYTGEQVLHEALEKTESMNIAIEENELKKYYAPDKSFMYPEPDKSGNKLPIGETKISYSMDKDKVKQLKKFFNVTTNPDLGKKTFEYVYDNEIE